ncbi:MULTISPECIES: CS1 type fimbrial major subunit [Yersinia]|uniref:Alpha-related fimbriae minor subunit 1 n=2 Tax=Yersinia TaxID=629 RepID=A0A0H5LYC4_YERIN|nr:MULTISPECIES: CS1 type fimbrial major subunit [Yersinia]CRY56020.1 alpha-related fimbriae minor subunit 1 [Yersinia intermedia]
MMKKTLLSIMAMTALVSATFASAAAGPVSKDITVEAKIVDTLTLTKSNGAKLENIKLGYDFAKNDGSYTNTTGVKIILTNTDSKINIKLAEDFELVSTAGGNDKFTDYSVTLHGEDLTTADKRFDIAAKQFEGDLTITAKQPAVAAGTYSGTLKLVLESGA